MSGVASHAANAGTHDGAAGLLARSAQQPSGQPGQRQRERDFVGDASAGSRSGSVQRTQGEVQSSVVLESEKSERDFDDNLIIVVRPKQVIIIFPPPPDCRGGYTYPLTWVVHVDETRVKNRTMYFKSKMDSISEYRIVQRNDFKLQTSVFY